MALSIKGEAIKSLFGSPLMRRIVRRFGGTYHGILPCEKGFGGSLFLQKKVPPVSSEATNLRPQAPKQEG